MQIGDQYNSKWHDSNWEVSTICSSFSRKSYSWIFNLGTQRPWGNALKCIGHIVTTNDAKCYKLPTQHHYKKRQY
jgi:hypothetical protein